MEAQQTEGELAVVRDRLAVLEAQINVLWVAVWTAGALALVMPLAVYLLLRPVP